MLLRRRPMLSRRKFLAVSVAALAGAAVPVALAGDGRKTVLVVSEDCARTLGPLMNQVDNVIVDKVLAGKQWFHASYYDQNL